MPIQNDQALMKRMLNTLDEAQQRWFVGREALRWGRGGIRRMCRVSGLSKPTVIKGIQELQSGTRLRVGERIRKVGGGRKKIEERDPKAIQSLVRIMDETTAGDPMSLLKWTNKSTYKIRDQLESLGHRLSEDTVQRLLKQMDYSLQGNQKDKEGVSGPGRDEQFRYINRKAREYMVQGEPVISVDAKKKEHEGNFKNSGRKWRRSGHAPEVNIYDYPSLAEGPAIPYGAYDVGRNKGMVNVGMTHDTAEFVVESIRRWWRLMGRRCYPGSRRWLICADGGGSNRSRNRAWKYHLQQLSRELSVEITVCHYPPGTSKWNKIEHRLFSFISMNWRGEPLVSYETVVNLISATTTRTGLKVKAVLDARKYAMGVQISDAEMAGLNLCPHEKHPQWNYTLRPGTPSI